MPSELAAARSAYGRAAAQAQQLAPASLSAAKEALDRAEDAYAQQADSRDVRDWAYIAERKAQVAEARASIALVQKQQHVTAQTLHEAKEDAGNASTSDDTAPKSP